MPVVSIQNLSIGFRGPSLLDEVSCQFEAGQRIGLLGRNGAGKTTFMRILQGEIEPDHGDVVFDAGAKVAFLPQGVPRDLSGTISDIVATAFASRDDRSGDHDDHDTEHWDHERRVEQILSRMALDGTAEFSTLSSGMKRRVLLAKAIVTEPDLLLLDEPTNHLDIDAIQWLEKFLAGWKGTLLFVTHDRAFLRNLATRILEIDRGKLFDWSCDYDTFLKRKEAALEAQAKQDALFDKKLAEEEVWIRKGIKARRTRNEGRVRALEQLRRERQARRKEVGNVRLQIQAGKRSGNLIAEVEDASFAYDQQVIFKDLSTMILRGDKVGIIGPNGVGKTTLLRVLLGKLEPQSGKVRMGVNLQVAYFDQLREQLNEEASVQENVGDGYDTIKINGQSKHVLGYLQDFLFTPERARTEVKFLSGGERNRILLAKLFAKPANVIVLDEPTNDLDSETLELLEERLIDFQGTVLLVSHDRQFLNNVVTSTLAYEGNGFKEYAGGYDDWVRQTAAHRAAEEEKKAAKKKSESAKEAKSKPKADKPRRLSFKEKKELEALPETIERLESEISDLHELMANPDFYQKSGEEIATSTERLKELEELLATTYTRWEELEALA